MIRKYLCHRLVAKLEYHKAKADSLAVAQAKLDSDAYYDEIAEHIGKAAQISRLIDLRYRNKG